MLNMRASRALIMGVSIEGALTMRPQSGCIGSTGIHGVNSSRLPT